MLVFELSLGSTSSMSREPATTAYQYVPCSPGLYTAGGERRVSEVRERGGGKEGKKERGRGGREGGREEEEEVGKGDRAGDTMA